MKNILAISGSLKQRSSNEKILKFIQESTKETAIIEIYLDLANLPFFTPELADNDVPQIVQDFLHKIAVSDAVFICSPEYVFSLPGVLKNALEWTVSTTVLNYKPVAFIIAAASGEKAFDSLDLIMSTLVQRAIPEERKLLIKGNSKYFDDSDQPVDNQLKAKFTAMIEHLLS